MYVYIRPTQTPSVLCTAACNQLRHLDPSDLLQELSKLGFKLFDTCMNSQYIAYQSKGGPRGKLLYKARLSTFIDPTKPAGPWVGAAEEGIRPTNTLVKEFPSRLASLGTKSIAERQ